LADRANLGDVGSSVVNPPSTCSVLAGLTEALGTNRIVHVDAADTAGSVGAAASADAAVVVVGLTAADEGEFLVAQDPDALAVLGPVFRLLGPVVRRFGAGRRVGGAGPAWRLGSGRRAKRGGDRRDLRLRTEDVRLVEAVAAANERTIVVVIGGGAIVMDPWRERVGALLLGWYPGMEGGRALADVLLGVREPGGRLPVAIVADQSHLPETDFGARAIRYDRWWGQRKLDRDGHRAAYPFGFGLGYTTFELGAALSTEDGDRLTATVSVRNTGNRGGGTVVQVYAIDATQVRHLLGFRRVYAEPGSTAIATVDCDLTPISRRDPGTRTWSVTDGPWQLVAGQHSHDPGSTELGSLG
jgi:beta-glucosidase